MYCATRRNAALKSKCQHSRLFFVLTFLTSRHVFPPRRTRHHGTNVSSTMRCEELIHALIDAQIYWTPASRLLVIYRLRICPGHHSSLQLGVTKFRVNRFAAVSTAIRSKTPVSGALLRLIYLAQNRFCCGEIGGAATVYKLSVYNTPHLGCHLRFLIVIKHANFYFQEIQNDYCRIYSPMLSIDLLQPVLCTTAANSVSAFVKANRLLLFYNNLQNNRQIRLLVVDYNSENCSQTSTKFSK